MSTELVDADKILYRDQRVQMILPHNTFPVEGEIYTLTDTHMMIDVDPLSLPVGFVSPVKDMEVTVSFSGRDCIYRVVVHLVEDLVEWDRMWRFERPHRLIKEQKRKYFRVPVRLPIRLSMAGGVGTFDNTVYAETENISVGGVCFDMSRPVSVGQTLFVILDNLPGLSSFPVLGEVVRCVPQEHGRGMPDVWRVALNIEAHIPEDLHEKLALSVASLHRDYLKKQLRAR